ncbi:hypothetical protein [Natronococcus wangiae]|uniref:hypothetical protein n=1 Tax=Natronococcus wangiae TaxID=3068275 RepID=UPI00273E84D5|nr:hypothetical protein [Natronococcus sp. AD5]
MGRTNPTFRNVLRGLENEWQSYRRALRSQDQQHFDQLLSYAREHADAGGQLNHPDPLYPVLFSIALEQETRLVELQERVCTLEAELEQPKSNSG